MCENDGLGQLADVRSASGRWDRAPAGRQRGFTLIEISIVVIIVGLVVGVTMIAREMVHMARVKGLANDFVMVKGAINAYQDAFRALPGDDSNAGAHAPGAVTLTGPGVGNGLIDGAWNSASPTDESLVFWQHIRLANLTSGVTDLSSAEFRPRNHVNGFFGVSSATPSQLQIAGMRGPFQACSSKIPGRVAKELMLHSGPRQRRFRGDQGDRRRFPAERARGAHGFVGRGLHLHGLPRVLNARRE